MRRVAHLALAQALGANVGCSGLELDEDLDGVFPCESQEECPPELSCVAERCWRKSPPSVEIIYPEEDLAIGFPGDATMMSLPISLGGAGLELVEQSSGSDATYGSGYLEILLDGYPVATVTAGELHSTVNLAVDLQLSPGGHQMHAVAHLSDGTVYDNPGATARRFFWVDDGRPHVAIKRPFALEDFGLGSEEISVEVATLHFSMMPPNPTTTAPGTGHVHFYYDAALPTCTFEPACDAAIIGVAAPETGAVSTMSTAVVLPAGVAGFGRLAAVLRRLDHSAYLDQNGYPVWGDTVVERFSNND